MGCSESSSKREVHSNTVLPQETRKTLNRQPNFTPKTNGKRRTTTTTKNPQKLVKGKKDQSRKKQQEIKEKIVKTNKTKSWFFEKIKLTNL